MIKLTACDGRSLEERRALLMRLLSFDLDVGTGDHTFVILCDSSVDGGTGESNFKQSHRLDPIML